MNQTNPKNSRILAVAPATGRVGFAVLEGNDSLVSWGVKSIEGDMNPQSIKAIEKLITDYQPEMLILEDATAKGSRRCLRIRKLVPQIIMLANAHQMKVKLFSRHQLMKTFFPDGEGTKHALAETLAQRFPDELESELPPKRKAWMAEDRRMDIFIAVALVLTFRLKQAR